MRFRFGKGGGTSVAVGRESFALKKLLSFFAFGGKRFGGGVLGKGGGVSVLSTG